MKAIFSNILENNNFLAILVFLSAIAVTIAFWAILPASYRVNENSDYLTFYEPVARNFLAERGFVTNTNQPAITRPPLFPLMLVGVFYTAQVTRISEITMLHVFILSWVSLAALLLFAIARQIWSSWLALVVVYLWIFYLPALWMSKQPNSEIPFTTLFFASVLIFWIVYYNKSPKPLWYLIVGVFIGLTALVRPIAIGLVFPYWAMLALQNDQAKRSRLIAGLLILFGFLVTILPWEIWAYQETEKILPLATTGIPSVLDGLTFALNTPGYRNSIWVPEDVQQWMVGLNENFQIMKPTSLQDVLSILIPGVKHQPLAFCKFLLIKAARSWYGTDSLRLDSWILVFQIPYAILIFLGTVASWKTGGLVRIFSIGTWLIALYFWATTFMVLSVLRYMTPAIGLLFCLIPAVFVWILGKNRSLCKSVF